MFPRRYFPGGPEGIGTETSTSLPGSTTLPFSESLSTSGAPGASYSFSSGQVRKTECDSDLCTPRCDWVFAQVKVYPRIAGGTRVEWLLHPRFRDPAPHEFQLEAGIAGHGTDDWEPVGLPAWDTFYLVDDLQRVHGRTQWTHYRIRLRTSQGTYYSSAVPCLGVLTHRDARIAKDILRRELRMLRSQTGQKGILLKQRHSGPRCPVCVDAMTEEIRDPKCASCWGTGIVGGYYAPVPCVYAALQPLNTHERLDPAQSQGTVNPVQTTARMLASPQLFRHDVWIDVDTDFRWNVEKVQNIVEIRGVPLVVLADLQLCAFSDNIYNYPLPDDVFSETRSFPY